MKVLLLNSILGYIVFNVIIWKLSPVPFHPRLKPDEESDAPNEKSDAR